MFIKSNSSFISLKSIFSKRNSLFYFMFLSYLVVAQEKKMISNEFLLFRNATTGNSNVIYNDSILVKNFDFYNPKKIHVPADFILNHYNMNQYEINGLNYFAEEGCGRIFIFRNDSIIRIDNSFSHKNQFGAVPFSFNNEIYLFGGYGLFTGKKIITKYDFKLNEWYSLSNTSPENTAEVESPFYIEQNNKLHVLGGRLRYDNSTKTHSEIKLQSSYFDYKTFKWEEGPNYNSNLIHKITYQIKSKLNKNIVYGFSFTDYSFYELNSKENTISNYRSDFMLNIEKAIAINNDTLVIAYLNSFSNIYVTKIPISSFKKNLVSVEPLFYEKHSLFYYSIWVILILIVFFITFKIVKKQIIKKSQNKYRFILSTSKKQFKYKGKLLENLNDKQFEVLSFIFNQNNSFIELSDFNKLLSTSTDETYTTLTKRRDLLLKELKTILSVFLELDESTVFKYKKSDTDKRVKLLKLNCITELTD